MPEGGRRRERREEGECLSELVPLVIGLRGDEPPVDLRVRRRYGHVELRRETAFRMHPSQDGRRRPVRHEERRHLATLELVDHFSESLVQGWFTRQADRDVRRMPCFEDPLAAPARLASEARQSLQL